MSVVAAFPSGRGRWRRDGVATAGDPYPWYPSFNRNTFAPHVSAGLWGPQQAFQAPAAPVITREVTVTNATDMSTELRVQGTRVIVNFDTQEDIYVIGTVRDAELVVPAGRHLGEMTIGQYVNNRTVERFRIRGSTLGVNSGGILGCTRILAASVNDIHVDGCSFDGLGNGCLIIERVQDQPTQVHIERAAVTNNRFTALESVFLGYVNHLFVAGNTDSCGRGPTGESDAIESWTYRNQGSPAIYFDNHSLGRSFHRIRNHPRETAGATPQYMLVRGNTLVDICQGRIVWAERMGNNTSDDTMDSVWIDNNVIFAEAGDGQTTPSIELPAVANVAVVENNSFHGEFTQSMLNDLAGICPATVKSFAAGNTFAAISTLPAFGRAGDPEAIPVAGGTGGLVEPFAFRNDPAATLSITPTWTAVPGATEYVVFMSTRSRASGDASLYPWRYISAAGTTSLVITALRSGPKYIRVAAVVGGVLQALSDQTTYTPA